MAEQEDKADPTEEPSAAADPGRAEPAGEALPHAMPGDGQDPDTAGPSEADGDSRELVGAATSRRDQERSAARRGGSSALSRTEPGDGGVDTTGRAKKDKATARRRAGAPERSRTGPVTFVRESVGELRKVVYPTGQQLINYFFVVLVFVLFVIAFVSLLDLAFGAAIFRVFS